MFCPSCDSEYVDGYTRCASCDVDLIEAPPTEPEIVLVKIHESGNAALIPVIESLLDDGGIEYMAKSEGLQDLFGWGRFGTNLNFTIGPVEFYVRENDAEAAREILATLQDLPPVENLDE